MGLLAQSFSALVLLLGAFATNALALSCNDLGLVCPGQHPSEVSYTINQNNVPSKNGSAFVWSLPGTTMTSLTSNITCEEKSNHLLINASGIPSANVGKFPFNVDTDGNGRHDNPNTMSAQTYHWKIPKTPVIKSTAPPKVTSTNNQLPMGPIGFTLTGVPFYNPYNSQGLDAVDSTSNGYEVMDLCFGHPDNRGSYHHHYIKSKAGCLFQDTPGQHSPKIGYAFDGIPIYGPLSWNGQKPTDLDNCNGRQDPTLGYIYHTTDTTSPYVIGCYRYQTIKQRFGGNFQGDFAAIDNNAGNVGTKCISSIATGPQTSSSTASTTQATTVASKQTTAQTSQSTQQTVQSLAQTSVSSKMQTSQATTAAGQSSSSGQQSASQAQTSMSSTAPSATSSCDNLGLVCPGQHPLEVSYTINQNNVPSKDGSAYVWSIPGTTMTSLTSNITCEEKSNHLLIYASGIPFANVGKFPFNVDTDGNGHNDNPNTMSAQTYQWKIPKTPIIKSSVPDKATPTNGQLPMGPIGFTLTGVPFFNPYNAQGLDAVDSTSNGYEVMDLCFGHPDDRGAYHHHYIKSMAGCLFQDTPGQHSPKIGYAFDGIPIYGPLSWNGQKPTDLDNCNGRNDPTLGYIYHTTDTTSPYVIGCYRYQTIRQRFGGNFQGDMAAVDSNPGVVGTKCASSIAGGPKASTRTTSPSVTAGSIALNIKASTVFLIFSLVILIVIF